MDSENWESDSDGWETEEWETVEMQSAYGDTDSWTTTYEFPTVENDSTTTDEYSYTSDTSGTSSNSTFGKIFGSEAGDSEANSGGTTASNVGSSSSRTTKESSITSLISEDTDFGILQLPSLRSVRLSDEDHSHLKKTFTAPIRYLVARGRRRRSVLSSSLVHLQDKSEADHSCYEVPTLSPDWWQPVRHIRVGVPNSIRRYIPFSRQWLRYTDRIEHARLWKALYHLRVVMSTAGRKQPWATLHGEQTDKELKTEETSMKNWEYEMYE